MDNKDFSGLPGAELVQRGLQDLAAKNYSEEALLVLIASPQLRARGIVIEDPVEVPKPREHQLYMLLELRLGRGAHSYYNSLIRRIVSFAQAMKG